ncbi:Deoxynucleoside kinase, partial [Operophtera brumata]
MKTISSAARVAGKRPFRVSIEGNIGSGKSTCIKFFDKFQNVEKHPEPIKEWRDVSGHNLLGKVYSDLHKWTFPFQHYVHLTRLKIQTSPPANPEITVKMFESYKEYNEIFSISVYLKTSPQVVWDRMMTRGRAEESEVPLEYLQQVHDSYENWLSSSDVGCEVLTIDADRNIDA